MDATTKNKLSVIINVLITVAAAILNGFGFTID